MARATTLQEQSLIREEPGPRLLINVPERSFAVPHLRSDSVRREELLGRLEDQRSRPLIVLSAPAGYGKTTLLTQWAEQSGRPAAWVSLRGDDGDPQVLARLIATLRAHLAHKPRRKNGVLLVLDDAQHLRPGAFEEAALALLDLLPKGSQLAIASRSIPALPLGRMRAQRILVEFDSADLSMSAVEAAWLLRRAGVELDFTTVQTLVQQTEGWPAVLELAAVAGSTGARPREPWEPPCGDDHALAEYFRAELLAPLAPAMVCFLRRTSVLDRLSGPLCDHVLGRKRCASTLAKLSRAGVPLVPLDASHEWYRLHGLFREMLRTELRRTEPEIEAALHRRAADWHEMIGDVTRAVHHARSTDDLARTGDLLWPHLSEYLAEGRNPELQRWLSGITGERAAGHPSIALVAAHSNLVLGRLAVAEQWTRTASVSLSEQPDASTRVERAGALIVRAWGARSGARWMAEDASVAYDLLPDDSPLRASCCFLKGTSALLTGQESSAELSLLEGVERAVPASDSAALCLAQLAVLADQRGQAQLAADFAIRAHGTVQAHRLADYPTSALVFAVRAAADVRSQRVDEAKAALAHCLGLLDLLDDSLCWYGAEARILLARASLALGDVAGARELLAHASRLGRRMADVVIFRRWFDDAWEQFDARAEMALAGISMLTTAELRVLRFLPTHYSFHEIAQRLKVSSNTVKTHVHAVYRKLEASSRSEAVARATDAGLLGG
jgi:LuxR family transcriptional regulator, maltose regulon positive regulatory protein